MKGHTKIELFNAKTGKLEKCVEDDNMFTNALSSLLNDNIGIELTDSNYVFPLMEKAMGALLLLPDAEVEDVNNLYPHSIPTAVGAYNVTDASDDPLCGIYIPSESGPLINGGYKHTWEFLTSQGNGTISCAALTNYYSYAVPGESTLNNSGYGFNPRGFLRGGSTINLGNNCCVAGKIGGNIYLLSMIYSGDDFVREEPSLNLYKTNISIDKVNGVQDTKLGNTFSTTNLAKIKLTEDYTQIFANDAAQYDSRYYYHSVWGCYPLTEEECLITYGIRQGDPAPSYGPQAIFPWMDVYKLNLITYEVSFVRTIYFPTAEMTSYSSQTWDIDTNTEKPRLIPSGRTSQGSLGGISIIPHFFSISTEERYGFNFQTPIFHPDSAEMVYIGCPHTLTFPSDAPSDAIIEGVFIVKINLLTGECDVQLVKNILVGKYYQGSTPRLDTNFYYIQKLGESHIVSVKFKSNAESKARYMLINSDSMDYKINPIRTTAIVADLSWSYAPIFSVGSECIGLQWDSANNYASGGTAHTHNLRRGGFNNYMATINNLPQPITKTSDQTMKVTYTIMDAEE